MSEGEREMSGKMRRSARAKEEKEKRVGETILSAMLVQARSFIFTHPHALSGEKNADITMCGIEHVLGYWCSYWFLTAAVEQETQFNIEVSTRGFLHDDT